MDALSRLALVGSEWASYATPVAGSGRRAVAKEVAEEASERLARQGAREAGGEWARLYRAVSAEELSDILKTRRLRTLEWQEVKYFSLTMTGAAKYARMAGRNGSGPFTLIYVNVRKQYLRYFDFVEVDRGIPTVVIRSEYLPFLGRPRVLPFMPLVPL